MRRQAGVAPRLWAYTLIELLITIGIIAILASLLLPVLSNAKASSKQTACQENLRQLGMGCQMYAADNGAKLAPNLDYANSEYPNGNAPGAPPLWVTGNLKLSKFTNDPADIKAGKLFPYVSQVQSYHCPADLTQTNARIRVRSYSMNSWAGSRAMDAEETAYRTFVNEADLAGGPPAGTWMIADENASTLDDGWWEVTMNDSAPFSSFPATRHRNGYALNFADGHSEVFHLRDFRTFDALKARQAYVPRDDTDWVRLKQVTTSK